MEERLSSIFSKYNIEENDQREIIGIFNKSLIEISETILRDNKPQKKDTKTKDKRFASKKAQEYAEENEIYENMFEEDKITKKMVDDKIKEISRTKTDKQEINVKTEKIDKSKKEKVRCCGITKQGEPCKSVGTEQPDGAKKRYCMRHFEDWKTYECDSDSSDDDDESDKNNQNDNLPEDIN